MDDENDITLEDALGNQILELMEVQRSLPVGSPEWTAAGEMAIKYSQLRIECGKVELQRIAEENRVKIESLTHNRSKKEHTRDLIVTTAAGVLTTGIIPAVTFLGAWASGLKFEETGAITSQMMRNLARLARPTKIG